MAHLPVATWTLELNPSEKKTYQLHSATDLKITNAALGPELADANGRSTVILHIDNNPLDSDSEDYDEDESEYSPAPPQKLVLTSLTPGKIESSMHDTVITRPAQVTFEVMGKNTIHLSGYLYVPPNEDFSDSEDEGVEYDYDEEDEDEEISDPEVNLRDVSSDVEVMVEDLEMMSELQDDSHRFEEIHGSHVELGSKRVRESDEEEEDLPKPATNGKDPDQKLSKKEKKRLKKLAQAVEEPPAKKVKGIDGQAVPVSAPEKKADQEKEQKKQKKEKKEKDGSNAQGPKESKVVKQPNGLIIEDAKIGPGATVKKGSKVELRYIGKLADGTTFDSNTSGAPLRATVGAGGLIKGMDDGLLGMKERGERVLTIPPHLGYGKKGSGKIPKNATLTFELKLLKVS